jgi:hypothetical protein
LKIPIQAIATSKEGIGRIRTADSDVYLDGQAELCFFVSSGFEQISVMKMPMRASTSASADVKAYFDYEQTAVSGNAMFLAASSAVIISDLTVEWMFGDEGKLQRLEKDAEAVLERLVEEEPESESESEFEVEADEELNSDWLAIAYKCKHISERIASFKPSAMLKIMLLNTTATQQARHGATSLSRARLIFQSTINRARFAQSAIFQLADVQPWAAVDDLEIQQIDVKLERALYGLKQAARACNQKLVQVLGEHGLEASQADASLFMLRREGRRAFLLIYVDDGLIVGTNEDVQEIIKVVESFDIRELGDALLFLGLEIIRDRQA